MMARDYKAPRKFNDNPIANARIAKGMTQEQLAQAVGVNQRQISNWELGLFNMPIPMMKKVAAMLDMDWTEIADYQPEKRHPSPIADARRRKGMTQQQFAKAISVSQSVVSKYENGVFKLPKEKIELIADVLDIPIEALERKDEV